MFVRSCLAVALEYGYYNLKNGGFDRKKETAMFVDSGETHTTVYVVEYSKVGTNSLHFRTHLLEHNHVEILEEHHGCIRPSLYSESSRDGGGRKRGRFEKFHEKPNSLPGRH